MRAADIVLSLVLLAIAAVFARTGNLFTSIVFCIIADFKYADTGNTVPVKGSVNGIVLKING